MNRKLITGMAALAFSMLFFTARAEGKVYLSGPFNYYGFMGSFSEKWELTSEDGIVYTGTFLIPSDKLIFNITDYEDEDHYTIFGSSAREGSRVQFKFEETPEGQYTADMRYAGSGDWAYEGWPGGEVTFTIDFGATPPEVNVLTWINPSTGESSGVRTVGADGEATVFSLQGVPQKARDARNGIFIVDGRKVKR